MRIPNVFTVKHLSYNKAGKFFRLTGIGTDKQTFTRKISKNRALAILCFSKLKRSENEKEIIYS